MATKYLFTCFQLHKIRSLSSTQRHLNVGRVIYKKSIDKRQSTSAPPTDSVVGLSDKVVKSPPGPVGPGAAKDSPKYKNPEYFCYHTMSYHEAEIEMLKYRCPQPSNRKTA